MIDINYLELALKDKKFQDLLKSHGKEICCQYERISINQTRLYLLKSFRQHQCNKLLYLCQNVEGFYILCNIHYHHYYGKDNSHKIGLIGRKELFSFNVLKDI